MVLAFASIKFVSANIVLASAKTVLLSATTYRTVTGLILVPSHHTTLTKNKVLQPIFFVIVFAITHTALALCFSASSKAKLQKLFHAPKNNA
jgi:hypothetical protein